VSQLADSNSLWNSFLTMLHKYARVAIIEEANSVFLFAFSLSSMQKLNFIIAVSNEINSYANSWLCCAVCCGRYVVVFIGTMQFMSPEVIDSRSSRGYSYPVRDFVVSTLPLCDECCCYQSCAWFACDAVDIDVVTEPHFTVCFWVLANRFTQNSIYMLTLNINSITALVSFFLPWSQ